MNENDLIIGIGADLSSYIQAINTAKNQYIQLEKSLSQNKLDFASGSAGKFAKEMDKIKVIADIASNEIRQSIASSLQLEDTGDSARIIDKMVIDYERAIGLIEVEKDKARIDNEAEEVASIKRLTNKFKQDIIERDKWRETKAMALGKRIVKVEEDAQRKTTQNLKEAILVRDRIAKTSAENSLNKQRIVAQAGIRKELNDQKKLALQEISIRKKKISVIMSQFKNMSRTKQAIELKRIRLLTNAELTSHARVARSSQLRNEKSPWGNIESIKHAAKTTALYGAMAQVLFGLQNAFRATVASAIEFNDILYANQAVLGVNEKQSRELIGTVKELSRAYGGNVSEIQEGLITIGRAGVEAGKGLAEATKVIKEMALITGDTMKEGADVMSSFINVFKIGGPEVQELGDQMMYVANATRLSLKDFSTFSNYALITAKTLNMTKESTLALSGAFSKVGLNASTIGTSMARLSKLTLDSSEANLQFFREVGISQEQFAKDLKDKSGKGLAKFMTQLQKMGEERFGRGIKDLPELMKRTVIALKEAGGETGFYVEMLEKLNGELESTGDQAAKMAEGFTPTMEAMRNSFVIAFEEGVEPLLQGFSDLVREMGLTGPEAAETFSMAIFKVTEAIKLLIGVGLSIWAFKAGKAVLALSRKFNTLAGEIWATRLAMLGLRALPVVVAGAAAYVGYKAVTYEEGAYGSDEQKQATIAIANEIENLTLLADTYIDAEKKAKSYTKTIGMLEKTNIDGIHDAAIKGLKEQLDAQNKVTEGLEEYWGMSKEVTKDAVKGVEAVDALPASAYIDTPAQVAAREKMLLQQEAMLKNLSSEQIARRSIAIDIKAQEAAIIAAGDALSKAGGIVGSKEELAVRKELAKLTALEFRQKKLLQQQIEKSSSNAKQQLAEARAWAAYQAKQSQDAYQNQIDLISAADKWTDTLTGIPKIIGNISKEFKNMAITQLRGEKALDKLEKDKAKNLIKFAKDTKKTAIINANFDKDQIKIKEKLFTEQINGYAALAGAMAGAFKEGSAGAKAFMGIQQTLSLYNAVTAVLGAWASAPFPANLPAVAATTSAVIALLGQIGQTFVGGGSSDVGPAKVEDFHLTSDSLENALDRLYDVQYPMLSLTRDMRGYLQTIASSFGDIEIDLLRSGIDFGGGTYQPTVDEGTLWWGADETSLHSTALFFDPVTVADMIIGDLNAWREDVIKTVEDGILWDETSYDTYTTNISYLLAQSLAEATAAVFAGVEDLASILDINLPDYQSMIIDIGEFDTTGMSFDEITEEIEKRFSAEVDYIFGTLFVEMERFQEAGEGMAETIIRVATDMEQVTHSLAMVSLSLDDTIYKIYELTEAMIDGAGGIDALNEGFSSYLENFFTDQEQYDAMLLTMTKSFASLGLILPDTNDDFRALAESIDINSIEGATLFGELMTLADGFAEMTSAAEDLGGSIQDIVDAWLSDLSYLTIAQKDLLASEFLDIAKEDDTISTVDATRTAAEAAMVASSTKEEYIPAFERFIAALEDEIPEATTDDVVARLDELIISVRSLEDTTIRTASYEN